MGSNPLPRYDAERMRHLDPVGRRWHASGDDDSERQIDAASDPGSSCLDESLPTHVRRRFGRHCSFSLGGLFLSTPAEWPLLAPTAGLEVDH